MALRSPPGTPNAADRNRLTYSIPAADADADAEPFAIDKATGQISVTGELDHEAGGTTTNGDYVFTVTATDPTGATGTREVTISATDVNRKTLSDDSYDPR